MFAWINGLVGRFQLPLIGITLLVLGGYIGALKLQIGNARSELGDVQGQLAAARGTIAEQTGKIREWKSAYDILTGETARQNKAINDLQVAAETARIKRDAAIKKASAIAEARSRLIMAATARPASGGDCVAAVDLAKRDLRGEL